MSWFNEVHMSSANTSNVNLSMGEKFRRFGQAQFASSYARGGMAAYMFSPGGRRPGGLFFGGTTEGSTRHLSRLQKMKASGMYDDARIDKAIKSAEAHNLKTKKSWGELSKLGKTGRVAGALTKTGPMAVITGAVAAGVTEGSAGDKATAGLAMGVGATVGWEVGSKAGMAAGAAVGSVVPVVGTAIGAAAGYIIGGLAGAYVGEEGIHGIRNTMDANVKMVRKQREHRGWYGDTSAFDTQRAATMRQASLQMMNQGMMSARSALGHEGVMIHR